METTATVKSTTVESTPKAATETTYKPMWMEEKRPAESESAPDDHRITVVVRVSIRRIGIAINIIRRCIDRRRLIDVSCRWRRNSGRRISRVIRNRRLIRRSVHNHGQITHRLRQHRLKLSA